jgi:hypothetical protein
MIGIENSYGNERRDAIMENASVGPVIPDTSKLRPPI